MATKVKICGLKTRSRARRGARGRRRLRRPRVLPAEPAQHGAGRGQGAGRQGARPRQDRGPDGRPGRCADRHGHGLGGARSAAAAWRGDAGARGRHPPPLGPAGHEGHQGGDGADARAALGYREAADLILFDARAPADSTRPGGNGAPFDWRTLLGVKDQVPYMLSGGLTPDNVAEAIRATGAAIVDVSSGVEFEPRRKGPGTHPPLPSGGKRGIT